MMAKHTLMIIIILYWLKEGYPSKLFIPNTDLIISYDTINI